MAGKPVMYILIEVKDDMSVGIHVEGPDQRPVPMTGAELRAFFTNVAKNIEDVDTN